MSSLSRYLTAGLISVALAQSAWAQGILDVYGEAAESDPTLKQAAADRLSARESEPQARALLLPQLDARGTATRTFTDSKRKEFTGSDADIGSISARVTVTQPIFNRGNQVRVRQSEFIVDKADNDYVNAQQDLILRVAQNYFDVLARCDDLIFTDADRRAIANQLEQAKKRFEVGLITITDVQEAQAQYDLAVANEISVRNNLSDSKEALREITGTYFDRLATLSNRVPLGPPDPAAPEVWVEQAMETSPVLLSASYAAETARENVDLQRANRYPTLDLTATIVDSETDGDPDRRLDLDFNRQSTIGLELNIPIYEGGAKSSRIREAAYQYESAKEFLEIQQRNISRTVRNAYRGLLAAISQVDALDQARVSNRSALEATQAGFDVGTRTIVDVLNAQRNLFRAERDYSQSRYTYILNDLLLKRAAGLIAVEDLERINGWLDPPDSESLCAAANRLQ